MSALFSVFFGAKRDLFVNFAILLCVIFWFPLAKNNYPSGLAQVTPTFDAFIIMLLLSSIIHFVTRIFIKGKIANYLYFLSMLLLFVGNIIFLIFSASFTTNGCDILAEYEDYFVTHYDQCWFGSFISYVSLVLMNNYFMILIFINCIKFDNKNKNENENENKSLIEKAQDIFNNNILRFYYLIITIICSFLFCLFYDITYIDVYSKGFYIWFYLSMTFNVLSIITGYIFRFIIIFQSKNYAFISLIIWCFIALCVYIFGCIAYWPNGSNISDNIAFLGENFMWSYVNVWFLNEAFYPIINKDDEYKYDPIAPV